MAKTLKRKIRKGNLSPTEIFDQVVSSKYFDSIFAELLKDLKETASYRRLKELSMQVNLNRASDSCNISSDSNELKQKESYSSEIGILALSIDSAISQNIRRKLRNECRLVIKDKVKGSSYCKNRNISVSSSSFNGNKVAREINAEFDVPCNTDFQNDRSFSVQSENESKIFNELEGMRLGSAQNLKDINVFMTEVIKEEYGHEKASGKEVNISSQPAKSQTSNCRPVGKRTVVNKGSAVNSTCHMYQKDCSISLTKDKTMNKSVSTKGNCFNRDISNIVTCIADKDTGADVESNLSVGDFSVGSLSSVHTSDLSSFDDEVSMDSEDERGIKRKRRISLNVAKDWCLKNVFPSGKKNVAIKARCRTSYPQPSRSRSAHSVNKSPAITFSTPRKSLPQRIRKPNLKYIINCISPLSKNSSLHMNMPVSSNSASFGKTRRRARLSKKHVQPRKEISSSLNCSMYALPGVSEPSSLKSSGSDIFVKEEIESEDEVPSLRMERNAMKIYELTELYPRLPESYE